MRSSSGLTNSTRRPTRSWRSERRCGGGSRESLTRSVGEGVLLTKRGEEETFGRAFRRGQETCAEQKVRRPSLNVDRPTRALLVRTRGAGLRKKITVRLQGAHQR